MSAPRGRGLRPGGVVRALARLVLLVGIGFAAGLAIGVLSQEPELLAGHLRGDGESIALTSPALDENDVSEEPATSEREVVRAEVEREAVMKSAAEEPRTEPLPIVAARPPASSADPQAFRGWAIQVGAFSDEAAAKGLARALDAKGYPTELLEASEDAQRWRVRIQPIRGEAKARELAAKLKRVERLPTWVIPMEDRAPQ